MKGFLSFRFGSKFSSWILAVNFLMLATVTLAQAQDKVVLEERESGSSNLVSARLVEKVLHCEQCVSSLGKINRLSIDERKLFVSDTAAFAETHPGVISLPSRSLPSQSEADLESPNSQNSISAGENGPEISGEDAATPSGSNANLLLGMRKLVLDGMSQETGEGSTTGSTPATVGSQTVRSEDEGGTLPTSQDPQNFPPSTADGGTDGGAGEAQAPRQVEAPPELQPKPERFVSGPITGIIYLLVKIFGDQDPNAVGAAVVPTPAMQSALPGMLGKGIVTSHNSDPSENRGFQSSEDPNGNIPRATQTSGSFNPTIHNVVDPNVVDKIDAAIPQFDSGTQGGCHSNGGSPTVCS